MTLTPVAVYEPRIWINEMTIHQYKVAELEDSVVQFLLPLCQEAALHPTPHARVRLNNRPVRNSGTPGMFPRLRRCPTCYAGTGA